MCSSLSARQGGSWELYFKRNAAEGKGEIM